MSESSASANTNLSMFSLSGTNADSDQQNEAAAVLLASGVTVDDTLNLLLQEQAALGGSLAAVTTQP